MIRKRKYKIHRNSNNGKCISRILALSLIFRRTLEIKLHAKIRILLKPKWIPWLPKYLPCLDKWISEHKIEWNGPHSTIYAIAWASVAVTEKYEQL